MNFKFLYLIGSFILFLGLLWMFLPHAYHSLIIEEDKKSHYLHLLQGTIIAILGLILMVHSNKIEKSKTRERNKS